MRCDLSRGKGDKIIEAEIAFADNAAPPPEKFPHDAVGFARIYVIRTHEVEAGAEMFD